MAPTEVWCEKCQHSRGKALECLAVTLADKNRRVAERCSSGVEKGVREQARREGKPHVGADMLPPGGQ